jgi:multiple sugar transport system substrate-binding protein
MRRATIIVSVIVACVVLVAVAIGCGSSSGGGTSNQPASPGASPTGVVNVTMWHGEADYSAKAYNVLVAQWNKANPNIQVKAVFDGGSDYALQKTLTAIAGGKYPDIVYLFGSWMANIARSPKVVLLNDLIANDTSFDWNDFWPAERLAATVDGKVVGLPALVDNLAIVYNKKLFDKAGVAYPTAQWTWDDFRAAAKRLTDPAVNQFGWAFPADGSEDTVWHWEAMLWDYGGDILTPDNKQAAFNSAQGVQALTMLGDMATVDRSVYVDTSNSKIQSIFNSGKIGMLVTGPWDLTAVAGVDYGVQVMPANHQTISGPDNWVLLDKGDARARAAWEFISWYTAAQQNMRYALATSVLPIRDSETKLPGFPAYVKKYPGIGTFVANMSNAVKARPAIPEYAKVSAALGQAIVAVLLGKADARTALDQAAQKADSVLAVPAAGQ